MEENLESFVTLLNKHRQARPASEDLAHLPDWARRALSKTPDQPTPPRLQPVNGKPEATPKSEIVLAPAGTTPVAAEPPTARAVEAREPKTLLANLLTKGGERSPSRRRAPMPAAPIPLDEPSRLIEKSIAALSAPRDAAPPKKSDSPVAATTKGAEPGPPASAPLEAAPPVMAAVEPPPSIASLEAAPVAVAAVEPPPSIVSVEAVPAVVAAVEPPPSIASVEAAQPVVAAVEPPPSIASVEAAQPVVAAVEPPPAYSENLKSAKAEPIAIAPALFDQILTGRIGGMTPLPAMIGEMPVPTEAQPRSADAEALPSLPAIVATMPASSGRRPLAYALAAVAVIGVVALVGAGGYWYARAPGHGVASRVVKIEPVASAPRVAAAVVPVAPNPALPASTVANATMTKATVTNATVTKGSSPKLAAAPKEPPQAHPVIAMATPDPVVLDKAGSEKAAADLITDAKPERAAAPATPPLLPKPAEPKRAATAIPDEKPAAIAKTPSVVPPPPSVQEAKAPAATKVAPAAPEISASQAITAAQPSRGSDTAPATPVAAATVESRPPVKEVPAQLAMLTSSPALVVPTSTRIEPAPAPAVNQAAYKVPGASPGMKGEPTWMRNAVSAPPFTGAPRIAIVIDDLGLDRNRTDRAIALKGPVTLSFLAYASDLRAQTDEARRAGHELIVHVPMEPIMRPKYITKTATGEGFARDELLRRLRWDLNRFDGYVGVNNHMGNPSGSDLDTIQTVIGELKARGLLFLDARINGGASNVAGRVGVPTVSRDVLLDDDINPTAINLRLAEVEKVARQRGTAVAVGHPHDQTLEALAVWLAGFPSKGLQLVPLTAIVKDREQHLAGAN